MQSHPPEPSPVDPPALQPPPRRRRWLGSLIALLIVLLLAGGAWYLIKRSGQPAGGPGFGGASSTVGHAAARQADLPVTIEALGTVTPLATITLKPQVGGILTEVLFTEGQTVAKGQLLARIDPRPYEQALMQAQGTRVRDEAQLEAARVTLTRYRTLLGQDSIARQDVDTQAALVKQLEGTVITDRAAEAAARLNVEYTRITAPVAGRIGLRTVDPGNTVAANPTTGIAVITQMNPIDVQFAVPQDRVPDIQTQIAKGAPLVVKAMDRVRSTTLDTGTFSTLDNVVDTSTGTVKAKARFGNAGTTLFPSQFVNIQLTLRTVSAVVVPVTAVRTGPNGTYVYVINEDRTVSMRAVKRGESTVEVVAITDGLKVGEDVVTEGGDRIKDGARVQLQGDKPATGPRPGASSPRAGGSERRRQRQPQ
ncbi:Multidrug transporter MdtA [Variovorax sp. SRS16]|uniref:efflux RND transporter periplasmic adaptor subunit n=1 Tax=Variovorax sp. SRS16 TaxID=282217 RepID=UPI0013160578|nr:efflux RND transporter periplasmic adaptor subunit [Variovorax sp. SRS16]VTU23940.1 Multidrug transporter MdtA [Variovorax sp. SRS16]